MHKIPPLPFRTLWLSKRFVLPGTAPLPPYLIPFYYTSIPVLCGGYLRKKGRKIDEATFVKQAFEAKKNIPPASKQKCFEA